MPIQLSNGVVLEDTRTTDERGYQILIDQRGNLYTMQGGKPILSRSADSFNKDEWSSVLYTLSKSGNQSLIPLFNQLRDEVKAFTPAADNFDIPDFGEFEQKATEETTKYFTEDFNLLAEKITTYKKRATEKRDTELKRTTENEQTFNQTADKEFADAVNKMQQGFAGRGTYTSGFRQGEGEKQDEGFAQYLDVNARDFERQRADSSTSFAGTLEDLSLSEKEQTLNLKRREEEAKLARQRQLQEEETLRRQSASEVSNEGSNRALNSGITA
jgi:hypothetical protein